MDAHPVKRTNSTATAGTVFRKKVLFTSCPCRNGPGKLPSRFAAALCPVGGTTGDALPRLLVQRIEVLMDWKFLAARRAAYRHGPSAGPENGFFTAGFAFHENLKPENFTAEDAEELQHNKTLIPSQVFRPSSVTSVVKMYLLHNIQLDRQVPELRRGDPGGGLGHEADGLLGLGEGDHVADRLAARENCRQPVEAERQAPVGRRPVLQGLEQEAELLPRVLLGDIVQAEHLRLDF